MDVLTYIIAYCYRSDSYTAEYFNTDTIVMSVTIHEAPRPLVTVVTSVNLYIGAWHILWTDLPLLLSFLAYLPLFHHWQCRETGNTGKDLTMRLLVWVIFRKFWNNRTLISHRCKEKKVFHFLLRMVDFYQLKWRLLPTDLISCRN